MSGRDVREARVRRGLKQVQLANKLGVSQGYVSLLERDRRVVSSRLARKLADALDLSPSMLPVTAPEMPLAARQAASALSGLGYPGFAYLRRSAGLNPAELLLRMLRTRHSEARLLEALPWVVVKYANLDWPWLTREAKANDLQNRLGFLLSVASKLAEMQGDRETANALADRERALEPSRLEREEALSGSLTAAEREWLRTHRSPDAVRWKILTSMSVDALPDVR